MSVSEVEAAQKIQNLWKGYQTRKKQQSDTVNETTIDLSETEGPAAPADIHKEFEISSVTLKRKNYTGGYVDTTSGTLMFNATAQTLFAHDLLPPQPHFHRETQTVDTRNRLVQTTATVCVQTHRKDLFQSGRNDRILVVRGTYETADQYHYRRRVAAVKIQAFFRAVKATRKFKDMKMQKHMMDEYKKQKQETRSRVQQMLIEESELSKMAPKTKSDFESLFTDVAKPHKPRKNELMEHAIEEEVEKIREINLLKHQSDEAKERERLRSRLHKAGAPKSWEDSRGKVLQLDTPEMKRARELNSLYEAIHEDLSNDDRLKLLLNVQYTVAEFKCPLTDQMLYLIARERDWLSRGRPVDSLRGVRQRLIHLFLQFIKTEEFNPAITRMHGQPGHHVAAMKQCVSCTKFISSNSFSNDRAGRKCNGCLSEYNKAVSRINDKGVKTMLKWIAVEESLKERQLEAMLVDYEHQRQCEELELKNLDVEDIRSLIEKVWKNHSAISGDALAPGSEISDLIFTRWNILQPLKPNNLILLRKEEAVQHDRFQLLLLASQQSTDKSIDELNDQIQRALMMQYKSQFVSKIKTTQMTSMQYCSNSNK